MTRISISDNTLRVLISKNERINFNKAKKIIRQGKRMILQNEANSIIVEIDNTSRVNSEALKFFERTLRNSKDFPIIVIGS